MDKGRAAVLAAALTTGANVAPTAKPEAPERGSWLVLQPLQPLQPLPHFRLVLDSFRTQVFDSGRGGGISKAQRENNGGSLTDEGCVSKSHKM